MLRGIQMDADLIIKATSVDGVYTADPKMLAEADVIKATGTSEADIIALKGSAKGDVYQTVAEYAFTVDRR